ncbi:MAG: hypothetical protein ABIC82_02055 [bacterium]
MGIAEDVEKIKERNKKVEADKAWEVSGFRRGIIVAFTYFVAVVFMTSVKIENPFTNGLIPTGGYFLSTLTLKPLKKWWTAKYNNGIYSHKKY